MGLFKYVRQVASGAISRQNQTVGAVTVRILERAEQFKDDSITFNMVRSTAAAADLFTSLALFGMNEDLENGAALFRNYRAQAKQVTAADVAAMFKVFAIHHWVVLGCTLDEHADSDLGFNWDRLRPGLTKCFDLTVEDTDRLSPYIERYKASYGSYLLTVQKHLLECLWHEEKHEDIAHALSIAEVLSNLSQSVVQDVVEAG